MFSYENRELCLREAGVVSSNLATPTNESKRLDKVIVRISRTLCSFARHIATCGEILLCLNPMGLCQYAGRAWGGE